MTALRNKSKTTSRRTGAAGPRTRIAHFVAIGAVALYLVGWAVSYATAQDDWVVLRNLAVVLTVGIAAVAFSATIASAFARALSVLEELGLVPALEGLVEQVEARTGVRIELDVENAPLGSEARPPRDVELAAYRVCQQALDNALLHARPRQIRVRLDVDAGHAELEVRDDGVGIRSGDEERALRTGHLGLIDMRGRAAAIGAVIQIGARPGGGTRVLLRWSG